MQNVLANKLNVDEERLVRLELERLFNLQDCPLRDDKKAAFVFELSRSGYPFKAIVAGIRSLGDKDLSKIKLFNLTEAIRPQVVYKENFEDCQYCGLSGFVSMVDQGRYQYSIPCVCARGEMYSKKQKLSQWNGEAVQSSNGKTLRLVNPEILKIRHGERVLFEEPAVGNFQHV